MRLPDTLDALREGLAPAQRFEGRDLRITTCARCSRPC